MSAGMPTPRLIRSPFFSSMAQRRQITFRSSKGRGSMAVRGLRISPEKAGSQ